MTRPGWAAGLSATEAKGAGARCSGARHPDTLQGIRFGRRGAERPGRSQNADY